MTDPTTLCGVDGDHHVALVHVHTMGHGQPTTVDQSVVVVAKTDECVEQHPRKPLAMQARGTKPPILDEEEVGVVVQFHLKHRQ
jgi:hypothetical protein